MTSLRPHRRRGPLEHVLVAGDVREVAAIQALLALLPAEAYGQVLLEAPAGSERPTVAAPARVSVNWLERDATAATGARLTEAVAAWVAEWMPEEPVADRSVALWVGATCGRLDDVRDAPLERL